VNNGPNQIRIDPGFSGGPFNDFVESPDLAERIEFVQGFSTFSLSSSLVANFTGISFLVCNFVIFRAR